MCIADHVKTERGLDEITTRHMTIDRDFGFALQSRIALQLACNLLLRIALDQTPDCYACV